MEQFDAIIIGIGQAGNPLASALAAQGYHTVVVERIHEDRTGRLWATTFGGGLHEVDKRTGKVTPYRIDPSRINMWNIMWTIYEDQEGILWIGSRRGIARFDPQTKQYSFFKHQ